MGPAHADLELAKAALAGERAAQRQLLTRALPNLRAVARAMMGANADAEDATQTAALRLLEKLESYRGDARFEAWSRRVATRVCIDLMRSRKRRKEVSVEHSPEGSSDTGNNPSWESLPRPLQDYLNELPDAQRQAVVMRHALDYSVAEVAEFLDVPVDTAKSRLLYGRRALRKLIRRDLQTRELAGATRLSPAKGGA